MGVLESQLSAKFSAISQLSVNLDKSQLLLVFFFAEFYILVIFKIISTHKLISIQNSY